MITTSRHLTVRNIAERFGVSAHVVLGWIARGELRAVNVATKLNGDRPTWRIAEDAVRDFELLRSGQVVALRKPASRSKSKDAVRFY